MRKAKWIELHDVNVVLAAEGSDDSPGWFWYMKQVEMPGKFTILGKDLASLFEIAGLEPLLPEKALMTRKMENTKTKKIYYDAVRDFTFTVYHAYPSETDLSAELLARVDAPQLLTIVRKFTDDTEAWQEEFTYSGRFTVCWDTDDQPA